jgi:hypothetical protein
MSLSAARYQTLGCQSESRPRIRFVHGSFGSSSAFFSWRLRLQAARRHSADQEREQQPYWLGRGEDDDHDRQQRRIEGRRDGQDDELAL